MYNCLYTNTDWKIGRPSKRSKVSRVHQATHNTVLDQALDGQGPTIDVATYPELFPQTPEPDDIFGDAPFTNPFSLISDRHPRLRKCSFRLKNGEVSGYIKFTFSHPPRPVHSNSNFASSIAGQKRGREDDEVPSETTENPSGQEIERPPPRYGRVTYLDSLDKQFFLFCKTNLRFIRPRILKVLIFVVIFSQERLLHRPNSLQEVKLLA